MCWYKIPRLKGLQVPPKELTIACKNFTGSKIKSLITLLVGTLPFKLFIVLSEESTELSCKVSLVSDCFCFSPLTASVFC